MLRWCDPVSILFLLRLFRPEKGIAHRSDNLRRGVRFLSVPAGLLFFQYIQSRVCNIDMDDAVSPSTYFPGDEILVARNA